MICYASRTGTRRNLDALRTHGWGLLVSRAGKWRTEGFDRICGENGAWADFKAGRPFDAEAYDRFLDWLAGQPVVADWLVLPDIVAGGLESLALSMRYINRCLAVAPMVLIAVQNGMRGEDLAPLVGSQVGIFLGGTTDWKIDRMLEWGAFCAERAIHYHVARVNYGAGDCRQCGQHRRVKRQPLCGDRADAQLRRAPPRSLFRSLLPPPRRSNMTEPLDPETKRLRALKPGEIADQVGQLKASIATLETRLQAYKAEGVRRELSEAEGALFRLTFSPPAQQMRLDGSLLRAVFGDSFADHFSKPCDTDWVMRCSARTA